jgi:hypothetical protein
MKCIPNVLTGTAALLLSLGARAQEKPVFDFRMAFYGPATDSAYAAEHRIRQVIKTRDRISLRVSASGP